MKNIFKDKIKVKTKVKNGKRLKAYENVKIGENKDCETILECIQGEKNIMLGSSDPKTVPIIANMICSEEIDRRPIVKRMELYPDHFDLYVDGQPVDLSKVNIDNKLTLTQHHAVFQLVSSLKICEGIDSQAEIRNMELRNHGNTQSYHARTCPLVCSLLAECSSCEVCRKSLSNASRKKPEVQNETENIECDDYEEIIDEMFRDGSEELRAFIKAQKQALKHVKQWDARIIAMCLNMYVRSPRSYRDLKDSNLVILPSGRTLRRYKNSIRQKSGLIENMFTWMSDTARKAMLPNCGYYGFLILDEMKVQEDIVIQRIGSQIKVVGFVETTETLHLFDKHRRGTAQREMANNVLQFVFLGSTGFRFPIDHFFT